MNNIINNKINLLNTYLIDWDDTLYPTSWLNKNKIKNYDEYKLYFLELDKTITILINKLINMGEIFIVTNANMSWINKSLKNLPETKKIINNKNITIISARDMYSNKNIMPIDWKKHIFENIIKKQIETGTLNDNTFLNIVSLGDADYEYLALIKLHDYLKNSKCDNYFLKNIRFSENPSFNLIIEQIDLVSYNISDISNKLKYIDLNISPTV
jgi:hypothetical protein